MSTKTDFDERDWVVILQGPYLAGAAITMLDFGVVASVKETMALTKALDRSRQEYAGMPFMAEVLATTEPAELLAPLELPKVKDATALVDEVFTRIQTAVAAVNATATPEESSAYRTLLFAIANDVANASGKGWFGMGAKVSPKEAAYLDRLRSMLSL